MCMSLEELNSVLIDYTGLGGETSSGGQGFEEKALGRLGIACRTQKKLKRISFGIHGSIEGEPDFFDFDVRAHRLSRSHCRLSDEVGNVCQFPGHTSAPNDR